MGDPSTYAVPATEPLRKLGLPDWVVPDRPNGKPVTLFVQGKGEPTTVHFSDVQQRNFADCFFIGGLAAVVQSHPDPDAFLREIIKDNGDGTYTVTFFDRAEDGERTQRTVVVNSDFVRGSAVSDELGENWPTLMEKAYIKAYGTGGDISEGNPGIAMTHLTGLESLRIPLGERPALHPEMANAPPPPRPSIETLAEYRQKGYATTLTTFSSAGNSGHPLAFETNLYHSDPRQFLVANHTYYVTSVDVAGRTVTVHNPRDSRDNIVIPYDDLEKVFTQAQVNPVKYDAGSATASQLPQYPKRE